MKEYILSIKFRYYKKTSCLESDEKEEGFIERINKKLQDLTN